MGEAVKKGRQLCRQIAGQADRLARLRVLEFNLRGVEKIARQIEGHEWGTDGGEGRRLLLRGGAADEPVASSVSRRASSEDSRSRLALVLAGLARRNAALKGASSAGEP